MKKYILLIFLIVYRSASANDCFDLAGRNYKIDPDLLRAIAWNESRFNAHAMGNNTDSSIDIGMMQINTQHNKELSRYGITQYHLKNDACLNIYTGAYYLAIAFKKWGISWNAVGAYNAGFAKTEKQAIRRYYYASKIYATYQIIKGEKIRQNRLVLTRNHVETVHLWIPDPHPVLPQIRKRGSSKR